jgi:hypothetical protein
MAVRSSRGPSNNTARAFTATLGHRGGGCVQPLASIGYCYVMRKTGTYIYIYIYIWRNVNVKQQVNFQVNIKTASGWTTWISKQKSQGHKLETVQSPQQMLFAVNTRLNYEPKFFFFDSLETSPLLPCRNVITARFEVCTEILPKRQQVLTNRHGVLSQNLQNYWFIVRIILNTAPHKHTHTHTATHTHTQPHTHTHTHTHIVPKIEGFAFSRKSCQGEEEGEGRGWGWMNYQWHTMQYANVGHWNRSRQKRPQT